MARFNSGPLLFKALEPPTENWVGDLHMSMRLTIGQLRQLITEELAEPDPFADKKPDIKGFARNVLKCEELMGNMPKLLGQMGDRVQNTRSRNMLKKAAGLAYHAANDLKALEAILTIVAKDLQKA